MLILMTFLGFVGSLIETVSVLLVFKSWWLYYFGKSLTLVRLFTSQSLFSSVNFLLIIILEIYLVTSSHMSSSTILEISSPNSKASVT
jgi:hypothetical protein